MTVEDIADFEPFELSWRNDPWPTYEALRVGAQEAILPYLDQFVPTDEPLALAESPFLQGFQRIPVVRRPV